MAGWIKIHRELMEHWVAGDPDSLSVFLRLLCEANFVDKTQNINGSPVTIKRGQLIFGYPAFSVRSGITVARLRRVMKNLQKDGMIDRQNFSKFSIVSIVNYEQWQSEDRQSTVIKQSEDRQSTTPKEGEEGEKGENTTCAMEDAFDIFWNSGMRKAGKQPAWQKFSKAARGRDPMGFAEMLADDIAMRLQAGQMGFDKMMPATYLHQCRWNDEAPSDCPHDAIVRAWNEEMPEGVQKTDPPGWTPSVTGHARLVATWEGLKERPRSDGTGPVVQNVDQGVKWFRAVFRRLAKSPRIRQDGAHHWCKLSWAVKRETIEEIAQGGFDE